MKRILSLLLCVLILWSIVPMAFATGGYTPEECLDCETNPLICPDCHRCPVCQGCVCAVVYTNGTQVEYNSADDATIGDNNNDGSPDNVEYYTVTVPAQLAPSGSGNVIAQGTWASNRKLVVTADTTVTLTNTISGGDEKVLDVTFPGITLVGSNTNAVTDTKVVSVGSIEAALFGTWEGVFEYEVSIIDVPTMQLISFTVHELSESEDNWIDATYQAEDGMTWVQWVESEYNTSGYYHEIDWILNFDGINYIADVEGIGVVPSEIIVANTEYYTQSYF